MGRSHHARSRSAVAELGLEKTLKVETMSPQRAARFGEEQQGPLPLVIRSRAMSPHRPIGIRDACLHNAREALFGNSATCTRSSPGSEGSPPPRQASRGGAPCPPRLPSPLDRLPAGIASKRLALAYDGFVRPLSGRLAPRRRVASTFRQLLGHFSRRSAGLVNRKGPLTRAFASGR
jgi:hypothetical protein